MTGLADSIQRARRVSGSQCGVAVLQGQLDGDVLNDFERMLEDTSVSARAIYAGLSEYFADARPARVTIPGPQSIGKHRRGDCRCGADR